MGEGLELNVRLLRNIVVVNDLPLNPLADLLGQFLIVECKDVNLALLKWDDGVHRADHFLNSTDKGLPDLPSKHSFPLGLLVPELHLNQGERDAIFFRFIQHGVDHEVEDGRDSE